jgi:hypothetical protein
MKITKMYRLDSVICGVRFFMQLVQETGDLPSEQAYLAAFFSVLSTKVLLHRFDSAAGADAFFVSFR